MLTESSSGIAMIAPITAPTIERRPRKSGYLPDSDFEPSHCLKHDHELQDINEPRNLMKSAQFSGKHGDAEQHPDCDQIALPC